jgi:hypothetical protein
MTSLADFFARVEHSTMAETVRDSTVLTGMLSGLHLIGLTLIVGSSLVSLAAIAGLIVNDQPVAEITRATRRATLFGFIVSLATGLLLVSFRLAMSTASRAFQVKLSLILVAILFHYFVFAPAARGQQSVLPPRLAGAVAFLLWLSVVLAGCAFILFE